MPFMKQTKIHVQEQTKLFLKFSTHGTFHLCISVSKLLNTLATNYTVLDLMYHCPAVEVISHLSIISHTIKITQISRQIHSVWLYPCKKFCKNLSEKSVFLFLKTRFPCNLVFYFLNQIQAFGGLWWGVLKNWTWLLQSCRLVQYTHYLVEDSTGLFMFIQMHESDCKFDGYSCRKKFFWGGWYTVYSSRKNQMHIRNITASAMETKQA